MSTFSADQQFPTFKRAIPAAGRWFVCFLKKAFKVACLLLLILIVVYALSSLILGQMLREDIAALKAKGEPTTMADLAGPKIPDSEKGAVLYARALDLLPAPDARNDLNVLWMLGSRNHRDADPSLWNKAAAVLPKYREVMALAEEASVRPKCRFSAEWTDSLSTERPLSDFGSLSALIQANVLVSVRNGRMEDAVKSLALGFRIGDSLKDEVGIIAYDVRISSASRATECAEYVLKNGTVSEAQAKRLFDDLEHIRFAPGWVNAVRSQRAMDIRSYDQVCTGQIPLSRVLAPCGLRPEDVPLSRLPRVILRPLLYADERDYLKRTDETIRYAGASLLERKQQRLLERLDREFSRYAILSPWLSGDQWGGRDGYHAAAKLAGVRMLLALAAYKDRLGSYPASLDELGARLGWRLPKDPYSSKDFLYRQQGKGFVLYSVGDNLKDDGAIPRPNGPGHIEGYNYSNGQGQVFADIIWKMDR